MEQTVAYPEIADADDLDLLDDSRFRPSRVTLGLVLAIVAVLVFMGGALVQRHWGSSSGSSGSGSAAGPGAFAGARAGGYGQAGGFPGGTGGFPGAGGQAAGGQAAGGQAAGGQAAGGSAAGGAASATPVVVGTVARLSSSSMIVRNLGGKSVTVKLPAGVTISLVKGSRIPSLAKGATVSVAGTTASGGTVTATSVTVR